MNIEYKDNILVEAPYLRVANVQDGYFDLEEIKTISVTKSEVERYKLIKGDVLLTEGGDPDKLGRGSVWEEEVEDCIHQNHIFRVRVRNCEKINPYYLSAVIGSIYGKSYFLKAAKQTTGIASINSTQLKNFPLIIAPIDLQDSYAVIAGKADSLKNQFLKSLFELENLYGVLAQKAFKGELDLSRISIEHVSETTKDAKDSEPEQPPISLPLLDHKVMADPVAREKLLRQLFKDYFTEHPERAGSFKDFWSSVEFSVSDYMDDESTPLGPADYDKFKIWLFDLLKSGGAEQRFDEEKNRMELRTKP